MSLAKNYQEKIVPQRVTLTGGPDDEFVIRKKDGSALFVVTGDGKVAWNGATPAAKGAALTAAVVAPASMTFTDPGAGDYAFANTINSSAWGFSNQNEANSVLKALQNAIARIADIEARLQAAGIIS